MINNPFPRDPISLPLIKGDLHFDFSEIPSQKFQIGESFILNWIPENGGTLQIWHDSEPEKILWSSIAGQSFVTAAVATESVHESRGSYAIEDKADLICRHQTVEFIKTISNPNERISPTISQTTGDYVSSLRKLKLNHKNDSESRLSFDSDSNFSSHSQTDSTESTISSGIFEIGSEISDSEESFGKNQWDNSLILDEIPDKEGSRNSFPSEKLANKSFKTDPNWKRDADGTYVNSVERGPFVVIGGWLFAEKESAQIKVRNGERQRTNSNTHLDPMASQHLEEIPNTEGGEYEIRGGRYWLIFQEARDHQLSFRVSLEAPGFLTEGPGFLTEEPGFLTEAPGFLGEEPGFLREGPGFLTEDMEDSQKSGSEVLIFQMEGESESITTDEETQHPSDDEMTFFNNYDIGFTGEYNGGRGRERRRRSRRGRGHDEKFGTPRHSLEWIMADEPISAFNSLKNANPRIGKRRGMGREGINVKELQFNRIQFTYLSDKNEKFFGFGEQFSYFDMKGRRVPILVQEQGLGRGDQPITAAANLVANRAGGSWHTTYAPVPHYITSMMRSLHLEGHQYAVFDLRWPDIVQIQVHGNKLEGRIIHGENPVEIIERYTAAIGRMRALPKWILEGAVIGMQGGTQRVLDIHRQLQDYGVPVAAFWLQDWVGQRKTSIGWQLWWNWEVDRDHYPQWESLLSKLRNDGVRTLTYCNPFVAPCDEKSNLGRNMFKEAEAKGYLLKDNKGEPYLIPNTSFSAGMLDLTNPGARFWLKEIIKDMVGMGVQGWMADFGEALPFDCTLFSGEDPAVLHNRYPELWSEFNREIVEELEAEKASKKKQLNLEKKSEKKVQSADGKTLQFQDDHANEKITEKGIDEKDSNAEDVAEEGIFYDFDGENDEMEDDKLVFFVRAGYRGSPNSATLFWEGDQMVSWQKNDGIKSSVTGLLSGGLSGYAFNHSDIGGYCTVDHPFLKVKRSQELLLRWMEVNAFTTVFRTHEGNSPAANSQFYDNHTTMSHFARCAKIYLAWMFYRVALVKEGASSGMPVIRHLFLHYSEDPNIYKITCQQFLVGTEILVAPVLDKKRDFVDVYFPSGDLWEHLWTGKVYGVLNKNDEGVNIRVKAPLGYPAVFLKKGSLVGEEFRRNLVLEKVLGDDNFL